MELVDLTLDHVAEYLTRSSPPQTDHAASRWEPVLQRLAAQTAGTTDPAAAVLGQALATPLMVYLARTIYSDTAGNDPAELLDPQRLPDADAIECHLLAAFIPAAYDSNLSIPDGGHPARRRRAWSPAKAEAYLALLARHLTGQGTRDLAWWQLSEALSSRFYLSVLLASLLAAILTFLIMVWLTIGLAVGLIDGLLFRLTFELMFGFGSGLLCGLSLGFAIAWLRPGLTIKAAATMPRPTSWRMDALGLRDGAVGGLGLGLGLGLVLGLHFGLRVGVASGLGVGLASTLAFGQVVGIPPGDYLGTATNPTSVLSANRHTAIGFTLAFGLLFGIAAGLTGGVAAGLGLGWIVAYWLSVSAGLTWWIVARGWLALTRRLPWRLVAFLEGAHQRGVLRQSGAVWQFRHARLQDYLAGIDANDRRRRAKVSPQSARPDSGRGAVRASSGG